MTISRIGRGPTYRGRPVEEYPGYSREPIPEAPEYALPAPEEIYPDAPQDAFPDEPQPQIVTRDPIERLPLDGGRRSRAKSLRARSAMRPDRR